MQDFCFELFQKLKEGQIKIHEYQYDMQQKDLTSEYIEKLKDILLNGNA